jgi:hypothetical protein
MLEARASERALPYESEILDASGPLQWYERCLEILQVSYGEAKDSRKHTTSCCLGQDWFHHVAIMVPK